MNPEYPPPAADFPLSSPAPAPIRERVKPRSVMAPPPVRIGEEAPGKIEHIGRRVRVTAQARKYALWELARRAGVSPEWFGTWKIRNQTDGTLVEVLTGEAPEHSRQLFFPHASAEGLRRLSSGQIFVERKTWIYEPEAPVRELVPDFVVPFSGLGRHAKPLFVPTAPNRMECTTDLPLTTLLVLSRWEESIAEHRDGHGRFTAGQSVAFREGYLRRPIVDEYGLAVEQALNLLVPTWQPPERKLRAKLSHDADHVGIPFRWKNVMRHTVKYGNARDAWRELWGWMPEKSPVDLEALREIVRLTKERNLSSAVYWMASAPSSQDSGYDPRHRKVRELIGWLRDQDVECGIQPGYTTFRSVERLRREVNILREVLGDEPLGGRQHYLRWCPETWIHWETCGLAYDSTLCHADHVGFRAGTCIPYRPWLLALNREADLLEVPLLVMDRTLLGYMCLSERQSAAAIKDCVARCQAVGGVFTAVWHNNVILDPKYRRVYLELLKLLDGAGGFDWRREAEALPNGPLG